MHRRYRRSSDLLHRRSATSRRNHGGLDGFGTLPWRHSSGGRETSGQTEGVHMVMQFLCTSNYERERGAFGRLRLQVDHLKHISYVILRVQTWPTSKNSEIWPVNAYSFDVLKFEEKKVMKHVTLFGVGSTSSKVGDCIARRRAGGTGTSSGDACTLPINSWWLLTSSRAIIELFLGLIATCTAGRRLKRLAYKQQLMRLLKKNYTRTTKLSTWNDVNICALVPVWWWRISQTINSDSYCTTAKNK